MKVNLNYIANSSVKSMNIKNVSMRAGNSDSSNIENSTDQLIKSKHQLSDKEKKMIIYKAQTNAAGWSILGAGISTLYYYLRSDKTIAYKYELNEKEDKPFIDEIRKKQVIASLTGFFGIGIIGWVAFKFFAKPKE